MAKVFPFEIKSLKQLYLLFAFISLIIALIISLAIYDFTYPYKLQLKDKTPIYKSGFVLYHDFNQDGFSEKVGIINNKNKKEYYLLFFPYSQNVYKVIDQFNFNEPINPNWIFFGDYTGDGYDETIVFTQKGDSLYLSVININLKKWILKRQYILSVHKPNPYHVWDIEKILCRLIDVDNDWTPEIVFAIHSGFSQHPRGVFIFDIAKHRITNRFEFDSGINEMLIYDLTGDQKPEIIIIGHATGNIYKKSKYTDFKSWLFVFDQHLNFVFPPKSFGEYPSILHCDPIEIEGKHCLLLAYAYAGNKSLPNYIYLMDTQGKIIRKRAVPELDLKSTLISVENQMPVIYAYGSKGKIVKFNTNLKIKEKIDLKIKNLVILGMGKIGNDGNILFCTSPAGLLILDQNLKTIARFPIKLISISLRSFSRRYNGSQGPLEFELNDTKYAYLFSVKKNPLYALLPFVFVATDVLIFLLLLLLHRLMTILNIYINFFLFSLRKSNQGIMLLDHKGRVFYFNGRVQELLHPEEPIQKKRHVTKFFSNQTPILQCFQKAFELQKPHKCNLNIHNSNPFKGELTITPFSAPLGFVYAYLIEVFDHTQPILSDRLKVWSRSVQKMAHDIKQPLSSISLNLKALQMRLAEIEIGDQEGIRDDIRMMQTEMDKVRQITNNFLKFVNLETPKFQWIDLHELIKNSINRFKPLINEHLHFDFEFDSEITSVWADPQQLEIVLHTIIENAIDAMKGKGQIRICTTLTEDLEHFEKQFIQIEIADSGPGIEASVKDNIFEPFFTTKVDGTGMGLAIAKKIMEDHNGTITIYSKEKIGTVVKIMLPQIKS